MNRLSTPQLRLSALSRPLLVGGALVATALAARLWLAWSFHGNFDQDSYERVQYILAHGGNVYAETARYNYAPPWFLMLGGFAWVQDVTGWPAHAVIRTFLTLADLALAGVLFLTSRQLGLPAGRAALLYLLNPVTVLIVGYHGPVDGLALLFIWLAVLVQLKKPRRWLAVVLSAASVLVKPVTAPAPLYALTPTIRFYGYRIAVLALIGVVFAVSFTPWIHDGARGILQHVFLYGAASTSAPDAPPSAIGILRISLLLTGGLLAVRLPVDRAMLLWSLLTLVTVPRAPDQLYLLPVAAGVLRPGWGLAAFSLGATSALLVSADNVGGLLGQGALDPIGRLIAWIVAASWLATLLVLPLLRQVRLHAAVDPPNR